MNSKPVPEVGDPRRLISALADGEADAAEVDRACAAWAEPAAQRAWHAYQLVGDVLRSSELASAPGHDRAFLEGLRARLAEEPALPAVLPLAPAAVPVRRRAWAVPVALAAGVGALATALVLSRGGPEGGAPTLAAAPAASAGLPKLETVAQGGRLLRDAQLDRYLAAHREYGAAQPGSLPGGAGRNLATVSLERP